MGGVFWGALETRKGETDEYIRVREWESTEGAVGIDWGLRFLLKYKDTYLCVDDGDFPNVIRELNV